MSLILDGVFLSNKIKQEISIKVDSLFQKTGKRPCLAVILIGENKASQIYVNSKKNACQSVGIESKSYIYENITQQELENLIQTLNQDKTIHGILVQLPLPQHIDEEKIIESIDPQKDVDGFHPYNTGKLWINLKPYFFPCTPYGIYRLLKEYQIDIKGKEVVILGRSNIVGKPMAALLCQKQPFADATVTICHSATKDLFFHIKRADVLIAAIGKPLFVQKEMVKEGVIAIDVGINRIEDPTHPKGYRVVGDIDFEAIKDIASAITPVPGGVGPMTIAMLLENTVKAFELQNLDHPTTT